MISDNIFLSTVFSVLKTVFAVMVCTFSLLLLLALFVYKFQLNESSINTGIFVIYFISNFVGGLIIGKVKKEKKFLWGLINGFVYFFLLSIFSFLALQSFYSDFSTAIIAFLCCVFGGIIGGMFA